MKKVKFSLPASAIQNATEVFLLGDFNNWLMENAIALAQNNDGDFEIEIELAAGTYQYKYFLNDGRWENDWNAEEYWFNPSNGTHNSIIHIMAESVAKKSKVEVAEKTVAKKAVAKKVAIEQEEEAPKKSVVKKAAAAPKKEKTVAEKTIAIAKNDLTKIDGITAKTAKILATAGINNYADLSKQTAKKLKEILTNADAKLATTDVSNWTKQAKELSVKK